ncbi:MAG: apolipoprotein N-acyltransferase [Acidobacteria bacterium]|nr:apolipoprotein N-acyltransferase [Acidobacteriota bacterium]
MIPLPESRRARLLCAAAGGGLLGLAFPPYGYLALLAVALLPFFAAVDGDRPGRAFVTGQVFGMAFWLVTMPWIAHTVRTYGEVSWFLAGLSVLAVSVILGVPFGLMAAGVAALEPLPLPGLLFVWPAAWGFQEIFRTYWFGGFPWALLANPLTETPDLVQAASIGGATFVSMLVVLVATLLYLSIRDDWRRARFMYFFGAATVTLVTALLGNLHRKGLGNEITAGTLEIGVVQTNVAQQLRWDFGQRERIYADLLRSTSELIAMSGRKVDLVLWPESASPYHWPWSPQLRDDVQRLCREKDVAILLNTVWTEFPENDDAPFGNAALLVTADGPVLPPYVKLRLVPFGEYVPFRGVLGKIKPLTRAIPSSFTPGERAVAIPFRGTRLGGFVCYEVTYPWIGRAQVAAGAGVLYTLTNDAWFGTSGARQQHWQAAVLRAVETGRPLVRAAVTGISGFVRETGEGYQVLGPDQKGSFSVTVPVGTRSTPFTSWVGDWVPAVCGLVWLAAILRARFFKPRSRVAT